MDKRTVYGSICGSKNDRICLTQCWDDPQGYCPGGCKEYVLADPVKYAKLEAQATRVTELETAILQKEEVSKIHPDEIRELAKLAEYWEDKAYTLEVKLESVERERDFLKQQLAKTKCECDEWRSRCESLESTWLSAQVEAAAMRQVLEATFKDTKAKEGAKDA